MKTAKKRNRREADGWREGGNGLLEELYNTCRKELTGWCRAMTQDETLTDDLIQEAFLRALIHEKTLEMLQPAQRRAWLYRTVKNLYLDRLRHTAYEKVTEELPENPVEEGLYAEIDCEQMLQILPEEERVLFVLRYFQGYNSAELGKLFSLPAATVRSRLASARRRLQKYWR
ncbi:Sigma-70 region 2 [Marvinbryantia formatexigens DSM 14469]|uniref:Sigma-70 region 2 n=2 Tax=Marvinbryantia TaxID=248744 RepID=C6LHF4_9FIRM|nr:RNA polymerase sigma factor [Marvinbryantia formatexigens]EET59941.1 Sigma-70 region 2 [Marvinbryantia formatexigens DSM 14469]